MAKPIFIMPERQPDDGPVGIERQRDDRFSIRVNDVVVCDVSEFNAVRLLGLLSVVLKIPLDARYAKEIKL